MEFPSNMLRYLTSLYTYVNKKFMMIQSVAYGGGGLCYWVCAVCDVTLRHWFHISNPTFCWSLLTQCISFYTHAPFSML